MKILLTGGSGFLGKSFLSWLKQQKTEIQEVYVLSRHPERLGRFPEFREFPFDVHYIPHDIRESLDKVVSVDYVIHAATESKTRLGESNPELMKEVIVVGTQNVLDYCLAKQVSRLLYVSSGSVYGRGGRRSGGFIENEKACPDRNDAYAFSKWKAEKLCRQFAHKNDLSFSIARCFAFVGPYLPINAHFAIGNFIRDAVNGGPIIIEGDGLPVRSYLYSDDLAEWLWEILLLGRNNEVYNVGSNEGLTLKEWAKMVAVTASPSVEVIIKGEFTKSSAASVYVPDIRKVQEELKLDVKWDPKSAILKTLHYHYDKSHFPGDPQI